jgi:hypothetical protein
MAKASGVRAALLSAARLIERRGWHRKYEYVKGGPLCVYAAIEVAVGSQSSALFQATTEALSSYLKLEPFEGIGMWNDRQRTRRPVVAALKKAAERSALRQSAQEGK